MSEHSDYVRPRIRRNTAEPQSDAGSAISSADRVLIRLPEISPAAQSRITPMPNPVAGSSQQLASLPKTEKPATSSPAHRVIVEPFHREPNRVTRVDAAHSITPGPHATAPDWLDESEGGVIKLIRRRGLPLVITASIIVIAVIAVRGRLTRNQRAGGPTQNQAAAQQGLPTRPAAISNDTTQSAPLPDRLASKAGDSNLPAGQAGSMRRPIIQSTMPTAVRAMGTDTQWSLPSGSNTPAAITPTIELPAQPAAPPSNANNPAAVSPQPGGGHLPVARLDGNIISPPVQR